MVRISTPHDMYNGNYNILMQKLHAGLMHNDTGMKHLCQAEARRDVASYAATDST